MAGKAHTARDDDDDDDVSKKRRGFKSGRFQAAVAKQNGFKLKLCLTASSDTQNWIFSLNRLVSFTYICIVN